MLTIPFKERRLYKKPTINVLFILTDLSKWKTEKLYLKMKSHPQFCPILGVTQRGVESTSETKSLIDILIKYLSTKDYPFIILNKTYKPNPDIVIYTEPYGKTIPKHQSVLKYFKSLFLSINYSCHTTHLYIDYHSLLHEWAWLDCYESKAALNDAYYYIGRKRKSLQLTGLPMIDQLLDKPNRNPWKHQGTQKKRIIWAPHHSIGGFSDESIIYSTFLECSDLMLKLAQRYAGEVQFAFKPHPLLKYKLEALWGEQRTNDYYNAWKQLDNGQLEQGGYQELFYYSDALIHDCSSFIVEYQVLNKPSLFLVRDLGNIMSDLNSFGKQAFLAQNLAYTENDIINFINGIIEGKDPNPERRQNFLNKELFGFTNYDASSKIIDAILSRIRTN